MKLSRVLLSLCILLIINSCKKDPCEDTICQNGGLCIEGICDCPPGYSGLRCQDFDPCHNVTCLNGGTCLSGGCQCPTGYSGQYCQNYNPCSSIICYNGGTCANGFCNCPTGYGGSDCGIQLTPYSMTITKIDLLNYPATQSNGAGWDASSGADPFITVSFGTSSDVNDDVTGYYQNATGANLYYTLLTPKVVTSLSSNWTVGIYDYDTPDPSDFMGGIYFRPINKSSGFPSSFTLTTSAIQYRLHVTWNF